MLNYSNSFYEIQKLYVKEVNLMLKDNLRTDFKILFNLLKERGFNNEKNNYSISDGKQLVWIKTTRGYKEEILIKTQSALFIVQLKDCYEREPEITIFFEPYEEAEKKYFNIKKSVKIYEWYDQEDLEFGLTACNHQQITAYFKALNSFLLNWDSLSCCLENNLGDYDN